MSVKHSFSRRSLLKYLGSAGALTAFYPGPGRAVEKLAVGLDKKWNSDIFKHVWETSFIDTHEHLIEERERFTHPVNSYVDCDDWAALMRGYMDSDLLLAGMPGNVLYPKFFSENIDPREKWHLIAPYWPAIKNTGYGKAFRITIRELYGIDDLNAKTVGSLQSGYENLRNPGFYSKILQDLAKIESCQVVNVDKVFIKSDTPLMLMQDIHATGMIEGPDVPLFAQPAGITVNTLADWHRVIDWWFNKYGKYATAIKVATAYSRNLDFDRVEDEKAEPIFAKKINGQSLSNEEKKKLEDHLFWYVATQAAEAKLPIKLHTGMYASTGIMPLSRVSQNAAAAAELCKKAPETIFVFMHIGYPYYEEMISLAKHYVNAYVDMCWAWIINPVAATDFLKKSLTTLASNKILTFGGDYIMVELVLGHAILARHGIASALSELVQEGWLELSDAIELIEPIMNGNARKLFHVEEKKKALMAFCD
jgi:uncharacterized protein